jgi:hypothetical protein
LEVAAEEIEEELPVAEEVPVKRHAGRI